MAERNRIPRNERSSTGNLRPACLWISALSVCSSRKQPSGLPGQDEGRVNKAVFYVVLDKAVKLNAAWAGKPALGLMEARAWSLVPRSGTVLWITITFTKVVGGFVNVLHPRVGT